MLILINPYCAEFLWENTKIYYYFQSFFNTGQSPHWTLQFLGSFVGYNHFSVPELQRSTQQIYMLPESSCSSKLTHRGVEINTCPFQIGCQLSTAAWAPPLELCFLSQSLWHEMKLLENWQLAMLRQSEHCKIDPRTEHSNFSAPLGS